MLSKVTKLRLRHVPLIALLIANAISLAGSQLTLLAVPWFVLQTTGSPERAGIIGAISALGYITAAILGGPLVDRWGLKQASIYADIAGAVTLCFIPLLYAIGILAFWQLSILVFLSSFWNTPGLTARQGLVPDLADLAAIPLGRVNAAYQVVRNFAQLLGPLLAGILIASLGANNVLWIDGVTFAISAILIGFLVPVAPKVQRESSAYLQEVLAGLRFFRYEPLLIVLSLLAASLNALGGALFGILLPVYATIVSGNPLDLGILSAGFGGGALVGVILYGIASEWLPRRVTFYSLLTLGILAFSVLSALPPLFVSVCSLALMGAAIGPLNPLVQTIIQERTPLELRGRVFGTLQAISMVAAPIGILIVGFATQRLQFRATIIFIVIFFLVVLTATLGSKVLRSMDDRHLDRDQDTQKLVQINSDDTQA